MTDVKRQGLGKSRPTLEQENSAAERRHKRRLDEAVVACLAETADNDRALADEFAGVLGDGL